jgi:FtsZ-interacting cell division protein YlmF
MHSGLMVLFRVFHLWSAEEEAADDNGEEAAEQEEQEEQEQEQEQEEQEEQQPHEGRNRSHMGICPGFQHEAHLACGDR